MGDGRRGAGTDGTMYTVSNLASFSGSDMLYKLRYLASSKEVRIELIKFRDAIFR